MKTFVHRKQLIALFAATGIATISWSFAQEPRERPGTENSPAAPREREGGARVEQAPGDQGGTPEGMPEVQAAPRRGDGRPYILPQRWMLGVHAYNTPEGVVVTRVLPGSAAAEAGLEPRDRIVTVEGFQIGFVGGQLYALGDELQHRAGRNGRVRLLVQNWRDDELLNLDVRLRRDGFPFPAPRER